MKRKTIGVLLSIALMVATLFVLKINSFASDEGTTLANCPDLQACFSVGMQLYPDIANRLNMERQAFDSFPNDSRISNAPVGTLTFDWSNSVWELQNIQSKYGSDSTQYIDAALAMVKEAIFQFQTEATFRLDLGNFLSSLLPKMTSYLKSNPNLTYSTQLTFAQYASELTYQQMRVESLFNVTIAKFRLTEINKLTPFLNQPIKLDEASELESTLEVEIPQLPTLEDIPAIDNEAPYPANNFLISRDLSKNSDLFWQSDYWLWTDVENYSSIATSHTSYPMVEGLPEKLEPTTNALIPQIFYFESMSDSIQTLWGSALKFDDNGNPIGIHPYWLGLGIWQINFYEQDCATAYGLWGGTYAFSDPSYYYDENETSTSSKCPLAPFRKFSATTK